MRGRTIAAILVLSVLAPAPVRAGSVGGGFFNLQCRLSHRAPDDPIVFPGQPGASHLHDFFGNRRTGADSTRASMLGARTTCTLSADTSAYWVPTLLDANGDPVPVRKVQVYYRSASGTLVRAFPTNLKIIAGGDTLDPPAPTRSQRSLSWACGDTAPYLPSPPDCTGTGLYVTAHIHFPDCWDGEHRDATDHRSHMTFGSPGCPPGYVAVPRLRLHVQYATTNAEGATLVSDGSGGLPGGTLHADFWNTWDQDALRFLVRRCLNAGRACAQMTDQALADLGFDG
ncbi:MAG TPA: DUF1996 domain-containing protein [Actinomycetota bacterium]|nr:DUF1996 domain-containing protein [Actinomycetota bacterium]